MCQLQKMATAIQKTPCGAKEGRKSHLFGGARYSNHIKVFKRLIRQSWNEKAREGGRCQSEFFPTLRLTLIDISYVNRKLNAGFHSTDSGQSNAVTLFQV